jgi:hypothetical protein
MKPLVPSSEFDIGRARALYENEAAVTLHQGRSLDHSSSSSAASSHARGSRTWARGEGYRE